MNSSHFLLFFSRFKTVVVLAESISYAVSACAVATSLLYN